MGRTGNEALDDPVNMHSSSRYIQRFIGFHNSCLFYTCLLAPKSYYWGIRSRICIYFSAAQELPLHAFHNLNPREHSIRNIPYVFY